MRQDQRRAQQSDVEFKYGLCDCCHNPSRCIYIWCCMTCAVADLSLVINPCCIESKQLRWWLIVLANLIAAIIYGIIYSVEKNAHGTNAIVGPGGVIAFYVLYTASTHIARRIEYQMEQCGCACCCTYCWCLLCKAAQIANQLDVDESGTQSPETVELITEINQDAVCKNCLCQVINPSQTERVVEVRNARGMNVAQNIEQSDQNTYL